jgi:hypothetical protein
MPFEHTIDPHGRMVVVRGTGEGSREEAIDSARRLLHEPSIGSDYSLMFVVDETALDPEAEEMARIVLLLRILRVWFKSRFAIVTSRPGRVTTSILVADEADDGSGNVEAFTSEGEATAWLLGGSP